MTLNIIIPFGVSQRIYDKNELSKSTHAFIKERDVAEPNLVLSISKRWTQGVKFQGLKLFQYQRYRDGKLLLHIHVYCYILLFSGHS